MQLIKKSALVSAIFSFFCVSAFAVPPQTSSSVTPGVWCTDFKAALAYAEANNLPVLAFWGESGCGYCKTLMNQGIDTAKFREWQSKRKPVMIWYHGANTTTEYKNWVRNPASGEWPYVKIYWKKRDGSKVEVYFAGRDGRMAVAGGDKSSSIVSAVSKWITLSTPGMIGSGKANLNEQLIASFEKYCSSWMAEDPYSGGYFAVTNLPNSRLEAVVGKTTSIRIPLYRTAKSAAVNKLQINTNSLVNLSWSENTTSMQYVYNLPANIKAGSAIQLKLFAEDGKTLKSTSAINAVSEPANSVVNPKWLGEDFSAGEWTMDLDAAIKKPGYTLALATGALWCPYCKSLESTVLSNKRFVEWAKSKNVKLVVMDNPKRSTDDKSDAIGNLISVGTLANGAPPTLLRYAENKGVSGAAYLSRKMVDVGTANASGTAEWVLERNHDFLYKGGKMCAPEALRTGYPTFMLVKSDGTVAGRMLDGCVDKEGRWGLTVDETLARLDELLKLSDSNEKPSRPSTTTLSVAVESNIEGEIQVNAPIAFYKLSNVPTGKVLFEASDKTLLLKVYETKSTLDAATVLASGTGSVAVDFATSANKYIAVSSFADKLGTYGKNTARSYILSSSVTLVPKEISGKFKTISGKMKMEIVKGKRYRLSSFASYAAFDKSGDYYLAKSTGTVDMTATAGAEVSYQIWNPGTISFTSTAGRVMESAGVFNVQIQRIGGVSGLAEVMVQVDVGSINSKRVSLSLDKVTWNEGEDSLKTIACKIKESAEFNPDEKFTVTIVATPLSSAMVETGRFELTVSDTDDPVLPASSYTYRLYKGIEFDASFDVQNIKENGRVTIVRDGGLPSGLRLKYDKDSNSLRLYGKPTRETSASFTVAMRERRADGNAQGVSTEFKIVVVDPKSLQSGDLGYNSVLARGESVSLFVPLYAKVEEKNILVGTVDLKLLSSGRMTAKYAGAGNEKKSFSGSIVDLTDGGDAIITASKNNASMDVVIDSAGRVNVALSGVENAFGNGVTYSGEGQVSSSSAFATYQGYYTVTLPVDTESLVVGQETYSTGTGYLTVDATASAFKRTGKVKVKYFLPNGSTGSITTYLMPDALKDSKERRWALLPVLKSDASGNTLGAMLRIRENAIQTYNEGDPQVVLLEDGVAGYWLFGNAFTPVQVYGGYYSNEMDLFECCVDSYQTLEFNVKCSHEWLKDSTTYGAIVATPEAKVSVSEGNVFTVVNNNDGLAITLKFTRSNIKNGLVTGKVPILFDNGKKISATFKGVFLPLWHDCGCSDGSALIERPFVSGTAVFSDKVGGKNVKRGFSVDLIPIN